MNRREFITIGIGLLTSSSLLIALSAGNSDAIRPPGVEDEEEFYSLCIRCGRCVDVCPTEGLKLNYLTFEHLGTPVLEGFCAVYLELIQPSRLKNVEFKKKRWKGHLCFKCIDVCPTGALKRLPLSKIKIARIDVIVERCIRAECYECIDLCVFDAIMIGEGGLPMIDPEKCVGCRQCEKLCPYDAMIAKPV